MQQTRPQRIVLASTSPYRRELLERLRLHFEIISPQVNEERRAGEAPETLVQRLAEDKAKAGAQQHPDSLVIGSDQVAVCTGEVLGKPGNHENARAQLARLSGRRVTFLTGLCLFDARADQCKLDLVPFHVQFRQLDEAQIERYLVAEQPYHCAGSFKSEGLGISLFEYMQGEDPTALIGLPLIRLVSWLNEAGVPVP